MQMFGQFPKRDLRLCNCTFARYQILTSQYGVFFVSLLTTHPSNSTCLRHWVITIRDILASGFFFYDQQLKLRSNFLRLLQYGIFTTFKSDNRITKLSSVQFSRSVVSDSVTPWITECQAFLSITNSWSSLRLTSMKSVMPSSHLILCHPLLLLPPIPPSIRVQSYIITKYLHFVMIYLGHTWMV